MNGIDFFLLVIVLLAMWQGWQTGFAAGLARLLVWVGSLGAAYLLYPPVSNWLLAAWPSVGTWTPLVSFLILFFIFRILLDAGFHYLLREMPGHQHVVNRALGIFPGAVQGIITAMLLAAILLTLPFQNPFSDSARNSRLAQNAGKLVARTGDLLEPLIPAGTTGLAKKVGTGDSKDFIKLPYTLTNVEVRAELEEKMLELVNGERTSRGLKPLKADPELAEVARAHSRDMFARGYFAHINPDGKNPFDRIKAGKVRFLTAGENLALGRSLKQCHEGLMQSPGHRANILRPQFGRLGIGILDGGIYGLMITQNFRN